MKKGSVIGIRFKNSRCIPSTVTSIFCTSGSIMKDQLSRDYPGV